MTEPTFLIPLWADLTAVALGGVQGALFASGFRGSDASICSASP